MTRPTPQTLDAYAWTSTMTTRWRDNDLFGHVNNAVYYEYIDTAVNRWLLDQGLLDIEKGATVGLVVDSGCAYFAPIVYPDDIIAGLRVGRIGGSSVRYEVGLFRQGSEAAAAQGHFVHVYVDRATHRPVEIPSDWRAALETLRTG